MRVRGFGERHRSVDDHPEFSGRDEPETVGQILGRVAVASRDPLTEEDERAGVQRDLLRLDVADDDEATT